MKGENANMDEIKGLKVNEAWVFENSKAEGITFEWSANIGFGKLTLYRNDNEWIADTECMGKDFIKMVLDKWIESIEVKS